MTIQLRYAVGPLERVQELPVERKTRGHMSLEGGSALNGVGQNVDGKAFVAIAVDVEHTRDRRFDVIAVAKDGRELPSKGGGRSSTVGAAVGIADFEFEIPLARVAKFRIGTRPVRTNEWRDVVLPHGPSVGTKNERARLVKDAPFIARLSQGAIELVALSSTLPQISPGGRPMARRGPTLPLRTRSGIPQTSNKLSALNSYSTVRPAHRCDAGI